MIAAALFVLHLPLVGPMAMFIAVAMAARCFVGGGDEP